MAYFSFFSFDILQAVPFGCYSDVGFHESLYLTGGTVIALEVVTVILVTMHILSEASHSDSNTSRIERVLSWLLVALYLVYPAGTTKAFAAFNCHDLGEMGSFLKVTSFVC